MVKKNRGQHDSGSSFGEKLVASLAEIEEKIENQGLLQGDGNYEAFTISYGKHFDIHARTHRTIVIAVKGLKDGK